MIYNRPFRYSISLLHIRPTRSIARRRQRPAEAPTEINPALPPRSGGSI